MQQKQKTRKEIIKNTELEITKELNEDMIALINHHLEGRSKDTISCYQMWNHDTVIGRDLNGNIDWMISYFFLDFEFDMIIVMQKENTFSKNLFKILRDTIVKRVKPLRIASDPINKVLVEGAKRYGGVWHEDEIWFY